MLNNHSTLQDRFMICFRADRFKVRTKLRSFCHEANTMSDNTRTRTNWCLSLCNLFQLSDESFVCQRQDRAVVQTQIRVSCHLFCVERLWTRLALDCCWGINWTMTVCRLILGRFYVDLDLDLFQVWKISNKVKNVAWLNGISYLN